MKHDADFHGARLKAGEYVALPLPLGNLDPKAFPDPDRFDLDRENKVHITFNSGPHRCVGSHLARLELNILYDEWLKRMPNVRPDPDKQPSYATFNFAVRKGGDGAMELSRAPIPPMPDELTRVIEDLK